MRAEQFSADCASVQLREVNASDTPEMRKLLVAHKTFFAKKRNVKKTLWPQALLHRSPHA